MKAIVLVDNYKMAPFVHERNKYYLEHGMTLKVVDPTIDESYVSDGILVLTVHDYQTERRVDSCDLLISHAPNIRNHYTFIRKYICDFPKLYFFFHGHEIIRCSDYYPEPYDYMHQKKVFNQQIRNRYDDFKLMFWKRVLPKWNNKSQYIFISEWLYQSFVQNIISNPRFLEGKTQVIRNCIGRKFQSITFNAEEPKQYDFITIRSNLDSSTYCIDLVEKLALENPLLRFLIIGRGEYFKYHKKPENVTLLYDFLTHQELITHIQTARCALMPTRHDSQGVMACELASIGMPLITSDIPICREVFEGFENVKLIDNNDFSKNFPSIFQKLVSSRYKQNTRYHYENTCAKELELFERNPIMEEETFE